MHTPAIAVVIPVRDRAGELVSAAHSVLTQTTPVAELIVVDDGSEDDVVRAVDSIRDERIRLVRQPKLGVSAARNRGVEATGCEFITFLDSDDRALNGWVDAMSAAAAGGADIWFGGAAYTFLDGEHRSVLPSDLGPAFGDLHGLFLAGTFLMRRSLFHELGGYCTRLRYSENTELGLRVAELHASRPLSVVSTDRELVAVTGRRRDYDAGLSDEVATILLEAHAARMARDPKMLATYLAIRGVARSRLGRRADAIRDLAEAARTDPRQWRHLARLVRAVAKRSGPPVTSP